MATIRDQFARLLTGIDPADVRQAMDSAREDAAQTHFDNELLRERMAELELALEDANWMRLMAGGQQEFTRQGLQKIIDLARVMYIKNPLIKRSVMVKALYVWAQGVTVRAKDAQINAAIQAFWDDPDNRKELTSHAAQMLKEADLAVEGNIFFVFFPRPSDGRVRMRSIPTSEIQDIVCDPDDAKSPQLYLRSWSQTSVDPSSGRKKTEQRKAYYPDWHYQPVNKPATIGRISVQWNSPVYHVRVGGYSDWRFGLSEVYASIDWARAYKEFLEDWASLTRSYSRFAFKMTTKGGARGVSAAKAKLASTLGTSSSETNPAPSTGSIFIGSEGMDLQPLQLRGANVDAEDGRRMLLMVAASAGLPETYYGDVSVGTLATAKTMDRPTELMMRERQTFWTDVLRDIVNYVLLWQVKAPGGSLRSLGSIDTEIEDDQVYETIAWNDGVNRMLDIDFPPILERDVQAAVQAVVTALTLNGQQISLLDEPTATRMILNALAEDDVDEIMTQMFPDETASVTGTASEARVAQLVRALAETLK